MKLRFFGASLVLVCLAASPGNIAKFKAATFTETTPLATNGEMIERVLSPFAAADVAEKNSRTALAAQPIAPREEKFGLYVPTQRPANGYGLLVWVSPLNDAGMPPGWHDTLEHRGVIFVTAARSGNQTSPLGRRIPLALIAATNVVRSHSVDPDRIWIAGFSGGARIAERMALAYPELFSGAILDGSFDDIGTEELALPRRERFERFLERSAVVFSSGQDDAINADSAKRVAASFRRHCFDRSSVDIRRREGHVMMNAASLAKAIDFLDRDRRPPSDPQCRARLYARIEAELAQAEAMARRGDRGARAALRSIDRRYGGLAAPRSLELRPLVGA